MSNCGLNEYRVLNERTDYVISVIIELSFTISLTTGGRWLA